MLLRHLIVLIIDARQLLPCLVITALCRRAERLPHRESMRLFDRSDQKTKIHVQCCLSPGCGSNKQQCISLRCRRIRPGHPCGMSSSKLALLATRFGEGVGGARRDRTDDLMLAKHALSQLSYGPILVPANRRRWWARVDSNYRPHAYQACALTT